MEKELEFLEELYYGELQEQPEFAFDLDSMYELIQDSYRL